MLGSPLAWYVLNNSLHRLIRTRFGLAARGGAIRGLFQESLICTYFSCGLVDESATLLRPKSVPEGSRRQLP
jgi:hypothetical protein